MKNSEIPGYWRDPDTGKYFKIGPNFKPPKNEPKALENVSKIERKIKNTGKINYTLKYIILHIFFRNVNIFIIY